jgi:replicative DNA helicase
MTKMESADWVIAKLIKNPSCQAIVNDRVRPFYFEGIRKIVYERLISHIEQVPKKDSAYNDVLDSKGKPILETRVSPTFSQLIDGDPRIGEYVSFITGHDELSDKDLSIHMSNIISHYKRQSIAKTLQLGLERITADNIDEVVSEVNELLLLCLMAENEKPYIDQSEAVQDFMEEFARERSGDKQAIPTGIKTLDYILQGGLRRGDFLVVASGTGQGKSTLANQLMMNLQKKLNCGMIGLEMDHKEYIRRQVSMLAAMFKISNLSQAHLSQAHRTIDEEAYNIITDELSRFNITYLKTKDVTINDLKRHFKILLDKYKCEVFFLDHMLLVNEQSMEERHKVGEIANFMKKFAAEHNVLCIAVSQMNRDTDLKNPQVKDISGGRGIEQAATQLITIGLPEDKQPESKFHVNTEADPFLRVIRLIKSRNSRQGFFHAEFDGNSSVFFEKLPLNWEECENGHYGKDFQYD